MKKLPRLSAFRQIPFEMIPAAERTPDQTGWWNTIRRGKDVPTFAGHGVRVAADLMLLGTLPIITLTTRAASTTIALMELLFVSMGGLLLMTRLCKQIWPVIGGYLGIIGLASVLNLFFPGMWGSVALYTLCVVLFYCLPFGWSLPLGGLVLLALAATSGLLSFLPFLVAPADAGTSSIFILLLSVMLCWFGRSLRTQYRLVVELHETQEQLREQMVRREELATELERTRIARDIHDVLSHSLAVLSIQVQAARSLVARDPQRLAAKLDDMASLLRESITESRRVVGLLREKVPACGEQDDLASDLRAIATLFNERTGIHCRFSTSGSVRSLGPPHRETLRLALREMLTNAHRHGMAEHVEITLRWREASLLLTIHDDGRGADAASPNTSLQEMSSGVDGHHGLQGMRERVTALGGTVVAGPAQGGGFTVTLILPFASQVPEAATKGT